MAKERTPILMREDGSGKELRVALGIPVIDSVPVESFPWHMLCAAEIARVATLILCVPKNQIPHDRARIDVLEAAIEQDADLLLFIDDDNPPPAGTFDALYKTMKDNNAAVVSGHYYRRGYPYTCVWSIEVAAGQWVQVDAKEGVSIIHTSGLGCALIDMKFVKEKLKPPYFGMGHDGRATTIRDDVTFFEKVKAAGGLVLGHAGVRCAHVHERIMIDDGNVEYLRREYIKEHKLDFEKELAKFEGGKKIEEIYTPSTTAMPSVPQVVKCTCGTCQTVDKAMEEIKEEATKLGEVKTAKVGNIGRTPMKKG